MEKDQIRDGEYRAGGAEIKSEVAVNTPAGIPRVRRRTHKQVQVTMRGVLQFMGGDSLDKDQTSKRGI